MHEQLYIALLVASAVLLIIGKHQKEGAILKKGR